MLPLRHGADYAAIERQAHELRREAMDQLIEEFCAWAAKKLRAVQDIAASVRARQMRNADQTFFEAQ